MDIIKSEKCDVTPKIKIFQIDEVILRDNTHVIPYHSSYTIR